MDRLASRLFGKALETGQAGDLLACLFEGGTATIDASTGELVLLDSTLIDQAADRGIHVETYRQIGWWANDDKAEHEYRWRVRHSNGEVMGSGEGYADARDRDHAVSVLFPGVPTKEVEG